MNRNTIKSAAWLLSAALAVPYTSTVVAESGAAQASDEVLEEIFVVGKRRAYQGNFDQLETPAADQLIDEALLREAGSISLDDALDLSASVARQNNFGGLWNSFSVRGFSGDINLPSGFLVNGFNAGRGFAGPRDMVGIDADVDQRDDALAALDAEALGAEVGVVQEELQHLGEASGRILEQAQALTFLHDEARLEGHARRPMPQQRTVLRRDPKRSSRQQPHPHFVGLKGYPVTLQAKQGLVQPVGGDGQVGDLDPAADHRGSARGVHREVADAEPADRGRGSGDGVGNVVQLEVEEDLVALLAQPVDHPVTVGEEELEAALLAPA